MSGCSSSPVRRGGERLVAELGHAEHVEHEHAVIGDDGASALRNDGRMRNAGIVTHGLDVVDDVVRVLLERVVGARFEVGLRPVVVHAQTAADVEILEAGAGAGQLGVDAGGFVERVLHDPDVGDLAPQVEVQELEAVLHPVLLQFIETAQHFSDGEAELRAVASRRLPAPAATRGQLDPHPNPRPDADLRGVFQDQTRARCTSRPPE